MRYFAKAIDETEPRGNRLKTGLVNRATNVPGLPAVPDCGYQLFSFLFLENQASPQEEFGRADRVLDLRV